MDTQNVTLSIPKETLRRVKHIAIERRTSISGLLRQTLEDIILREESYDKAHRRHSVWLETAIDLGTGGEIKWNRDELHER